jgi:hypothetical protein
MSYFITYVEQRERSLIYVTQAKMGSVSRDSGTLGTQLEVNLSQPREIFLK